MIPVLIKIKCSQAAEMRNAPGLKKITAPSPKYIKCSESREGSNAPNRKLFNAHNQKIQAFCSWGFCPWQKIMLEQQTFSKMNPRMSSPLQQRSTILVAA